jgi:hypothetical protein
MGDSTFNCIWELGLIAGALEGACKNASFLGFAVLRAIVFPSLSLLRSFKGFPL